MHHRQSTFKTRVCDKDTQRHASLPWTHTNRITPALSFVKGHTSKSA